MAQERWEPIARKYDPLKVGSIDGTDTEPHDKAVVRAINCKYKPNKGVQGDPNAIVFVARLNFSTSEETLMREFSKFGEVSHVRLVRDVVTGFSKRYAFVEYTSKHGALQAYHRGHSMAVDGCEVLVDFEHSRTMEGWVPRRFGGGFGGKKESGQLRFGCRDRPFSKPIVLNKTESRETSSSGRSGSNFPHREKYHRDHYDRDYGSPKRSRESSGKRNHRRDSETPSHESHKRRRT